MLTARKDRNLVRSSKTLLLGFALVAALTACGKDDANRLSAEGDTSSTEPAATSSATSVHVAIPPGTGLLIDDKFTDDQFDEMIQKLGVTRDQLIASDATFADIGEEVHFVDANLVGSPTPAQLDNGAVVLDNVVVVMFSAGSSRCNKPIGGSATVDGNSVDVELYVGELKDHEPCPGLSEIWRASLVVDGARKGMTVKSSHGPATTQSVSPPLLENFKEALIYPDELPFYGAAG
jgi:hypothetical protein